MVASGPQRPARPGVPLGGFHKPGQGQARAAGLPRGPGQEELVADVSPCANLGLPASGAVHPPACRGGSLGPGGPGAPLPGLGPHGPSEQPTMALGPEGLALESGEEAGVGWGALQTWGGGGDSTWDQKVSSHGSARRVAALGDKEEALSLVASEKLVGGVGSCQCPCVHPRGPSGAPVSPGRGRGNSGCALGPRG